jgi:hypothetical protein
MVLSNMDNICFDSLIVLVTVAAAVANDHIHVFMAQDLELHQL